MPNTEHLDPMTVVDENGIPDHVIDFNEITQDGFELACKIGAARGDQDQISKAIQQALKTYPDKPGYVLTSALTQLGRDLIPAYTELSAEATGIDWHQHCQNMLDNPAPEQEDH